MPRIKVKNLSSLFRSVAKVESSPSSAAVTVGNAVVSSSKKKLRSSPPTLTPPSSSSGAKSSLSKQPRLQNIPATVVEDTGDSAKEVTQDISSILCGIDDWEFDDPSDSEAANDDTSLEDDSDVRWFSELFNSSTPLRRKELSRDRKNKWVFKNTQKLRFDKLVSMCLDKVGSGSTFHVLYKLGRGTGLKEYNAFIKGCIETARSLKDEKLQIEQILEAYRLLQLMKERGFPIEEDAFGPFLMFLIDMHMDDQFLILLEIIKDEDPSLHPRLGYYEMLFWIEMNNEEKILEFCQQIASGESEMGSELHENYLLALCERDKKEELLHLLDVIDITRVSSLDNVACIFRSLGRLSLEAFAELFVLVLKDCGHKAQSISNLIFSYASSLKNTAVEDIIQIFKEMHGKMDLALLPGSYENLIKYCLDSTKVHLALDLVDEMCEAGLSLSTGALNAICHACEESCEFILVRRIYSMLSSHEMKPNNETIRSIINMNVRMKDFDNAYAVLKDLETIKIVPSASMYNAILAGYYREKNMDGVLKVLKEMKNADVKPDSQTFGYLISNCSSEEDIMKYYEQLKGTGVQATKHIFMALINAYAASGQYQKAKEVILDKGIPVKYLNEIKSSLISALALRGQISDALDIYKEMKQNGCSLEPKAVIALIERQHSKGKLDLLLQLLEELNDPYYWTDGCCRVILYCIRNKALRPAVDLLKKLSNDFRDDDIAREVIFDEVFSQIADMESPNLKIGLGLLKAIKEDLKLRPSRKCLDFLLSACVKGKDLLKAHLVWKEYEITGLPYNILSYLRMYQAYLAAGDMEAATAFLSNIPKDDPHVRSVLHACRITYGKPKEEKKKKKKKKKT
ncbi:pentatricopeptide repeat-containing protein At4g21880, mitochondrial-like [Chenopodium quinoa]|uniref:pentatricopeptide repeat-containing protein At4g21880, mitochondrial-like n=1 Tax=Chenopodium quinoa TaxID=63459 RepID=UPI000B793041|nr:pentatricopeptide repeat-containing protein At4g21880, mitochondrial-like [Chenopodium quinoa]